MNRFVIKIGYDGSKYEGLQKLKIGKTVQGELEDILTKLDGGPVQVKAAGRTDKGVHAICQVCMFDLRREITPYKLKGYLNRSTTPYLFVKSCKAIYDEDFHVRFSVKNKTYMYLVNTESYDPIKNDYLYNYNKHLDVAKMQKAAKLFIGFHNFRAFVIGKQKTCETIIVYIDIKEKSGIITIRIKGQAFYTYMVRNIVEILVLVGSGKIDEKDIETMLSTGRKALEYSPAPPGGLYLEDVQYRGNY